MFPYIKIKMDWTFKYSQHCIYDILLFLNDFCMLNLFNNIQTVLTIIRYFKISFWWPSLISETPRNQAPGARPAPLLAWRPYPSSGKRGSGWRWAKLLRLSDFPCSTGARESDQTPILDADEVPRRDEKVKGCPDKCPGLGTSVYSGASSL